MGPFRKIAALTPWYDAEATAKYLHRLAQTNRVFLADSSVLEIGCGPGHLSRELKEIYGVKFYIGSDYSLGMVQDAKLTYPDKTFVCADTFELPFLNNSFDYVYSSYLFHHLQPEMRAKAIIEQLRVARKAVVIVETFGFEKGFWRWPYWLYYTLTDGSYYRFTNKEWLEMFNLLNIAVLHWDYTAERSILHRLIFFIITAKDR